MFFAHIRDDIEYDIRPEHCSVGLICAAQYCKQWHRARILEIFLDSKEVKLLYIDYGTVMRIAINELKYLRKDFANVPTMAYRGCLSKIKPLKTRFDSAATNCFHSKISDKLLVGQASYIDFDEQIVYMILLDTSMETDFCINNYLYERGFAKLTEVAGLSGKKVTVSFILLFLFLFTNSQEG